MARFVAIGLAIYIALLAGAEWLTRQTGHVNPLFKVEQADGNYDWVILGASHGMPLDFGDFNSRMETETETRIVNLAAPGAGPLYNRFVLEQFLRSHETANVLYVVDSFAFRSPQWNEERFSDAKLLARTPLSPSLVSRLAGYVWYEGVDVRALLDYATGFSKLNNRDRFGSDIWEGEAQFDREFRPSATADRKRIEYLYPAVADERGQLARYLSVLAALIDRARSGGASVTLAKLPTPARFRVLLPSEQNFDWELTAFAVEHAVPFHDLSGAVEGNEYYSDTDHLNRTGVTRLFDLNLRKILSAVATP